MSRYRVARPGCPDGEAPPAPAFRRSGWIPHGAGIRDSRPDGHGPTARWGVPQEPGLSALSPVRHVSDPDDVEAHNVLDSPLLGRREALTVVCGDRAVPAWVQSWCRHTDRRVQVCSAADALERIEVIMSLAGSSVLVTHPDRPSGSGPVVAAVRDLPDDDAVVAEAASAARELGTSLTLAHVVPLSFAERSVRLDDAVQHGRRLLAYAVGQLAVSAPDLTVLPKLCRRRPHELVGEELEAVLLVVGGPRPTHPARVGLVASSAVQHAQTSVLLVPRPEWPGPCRTAIR
jgi:hypothetical protein